MARLDHSSEDEGPRKGAIAVIGGGLAGLITAHTLIRDGFEDVQVLTRDGRVGGNWTNEKIYPGLYLNRFVLLRRSREPLTCDLFLPCSVHGEYCVSPLEMPQPTSPRGRISGVDINKYLETFASTFLAGKIQFGVEVRNVRRLASGTGWRLEAYDSDTGRTEQRDYRRVVLCTGVRGHFRFDILTYRNAEMTDGISNRDRAHRNSHQTSILTLQ